jgi:hypothetical protein
VATPHADTPKSAAADDWLLLDTPGCFWRWITVVDNSRELIADSAYKLSQATDSRDVALNGPA